MVCRKISKVITGSHAIDGAGVNLVRVIGHSTVKEFDPFLMLDAFDSENPADYTKGFPWHPHRGIETVTYLISGDIEHGDSLGNTGSILDGGCQWMTAGSGIIHQEMPKACPRMLGLQLWVNLPAKRKMADPKYRDLTAAKIPVVREKGVTIAVVAGSYRETLGAMQGEFVNATMLDISLDANSTATIPVEEGNTVFVYILEGLVSFDDSSKPFGDEPQELVFIENRRAALLSDGECVSLTAHSVSNARCVLLSGAPLKEAIAWGGPIVMNTREELDLAFRELDENAFIKHV